MQNKTKTIQLNQKGVVGLLVLLVVVVLLVAVSISYVVGVRQGKKQPLGQKVQHIVEQAQ